MHQRDERSGYQVIANLRSCFKTLRRVQDKAKTGEKAQFTPE